MATFRRSRRISFQPALIALLAFSFAAFAQPPESHPAKTNLKTSARALPGRRTDKGKKFQLPAAAQKRMTTFGNRGEEERTPESSVAAEEQFKRAYPLNEIPISYTQAAAATFAKLRARGNNGNRTALTWQLLGPTFGIQPGVLSFNGSQYIASGRITAMAIAPTCNTTRCRLWIAAAGGGVWRTDKALAGAPSWVSLTNGLTSNAIGSITVDPNDPAGNTIYVGTGEPNASGDSEAGTGVFKSTDGGDTFTLLAGSTAATSNFYGRAISSIVVDPASASTLYVGVARAVRGISSVTGGTTSNPPSSTTPAVLGLYRSTDGGTTFSLIWNGAGSVRGVNHVELDPTDHNTIYASAFQAGIWRSSTRLDGDTTFRQVFAPSDPTTNVARTEFALTRKSGTTRIYAGDGNAGSTPAAVWRADNADITAAALLASQSASTATGWKNLSNTINGTPGYATTAFCTSQCWYDNFIVTSAAYPDHVWVGGSYAYSEIGLRSNGRAVVRSTTAGEPDAANNNRTFTDMTWDSQAAPQELHPDMHALVLHPTNPNIAFIGSDGGVVRTDGTFVDVSAQCDSRPLGAASQATCHRLLSAVPNALINMNKNLSTLQFQSLSFNPLNPRGELIGGTQDNGTWHYDGSARTWYQIMYGDGGQSGIDAVNGSIMFNEFTGAATDTSFRGGDPTTWVVTSGPLFASGESALFYSPIIQDPVVGGTRFFGMNHVWRTKASGGDQTYLEANCPEFTTSAANPACGDWVPLDGDSLTNSSRGTRAGGNVAALARSSGDETTLWAATSVGRVFISKNANADIASDVIFTRLDTLNAAAPGRFVTGIYVDPTNTNHAWISYSGYSAATPSTPGHVFEVTYDPNTATAAWVNIDTSNGIAGGGDLPVTAIVRDDLTGDLYAATDFGVARLPSGTTTWQVAGTGLPIVEVAGLSISSSGRRLYAATHGRGAWSISLP